MPAAEPSLERGKFRTKGLKEGQDDVRVFFKEPYNVRGKDRLLCFVSEHTVYPFVVVFNDEKWSLEKRFSEFAALDEELDDHFKSNENVQLPEFPEKKLFGSLSPALIKERSVAIEKYLKAIALDEEVMKTQIVRDFLECEKNAKKP